MSRTAMLAAALSAIMLCGLAAIVPSAAATAQRDVAGCGLFSDSECTIALSTGVTMAYRESGLRGGPVVFLLHGFPDSGQSWDRVLPLLVRILPGYDIIVPDLRGHGRSSLPGDAQCPSDPADCFRPIDFARDIVAFMNARGIRRASIVGHSMGTLVAQELGLSYPDRVRRLVLISTAADGHEPAVAALRDEVVNGWWQGAFTAAGYSWPDDVYRLNPSVAVDGYADFVAGLLYSPVAPPVFLAQMDASDAATPLGTWIGTVESLGAADNTARLAEVRAPTLVLYAVQDAIFSPADEQRLIDAMTGSCAPFWWKQYGVAPRPASGEQTDLGHDLPWEAPQGVAADIAAFLVHGQPTHTLYRTDPADVSQVIAEPGQAFVLHPATVPCTTPHRAN